MAQPEFVLANTFDLVSIFNFRFIDYRVVNVDSQEISFH